MSGIIENNSSSTRLPNYKNPPVNEVICGMRFHPTDKLLIPYTGLLWNKFRTDYPTLQQAQPIATVKGEMLIDRITGLPLPRVWFINKADDQLVQFQNDRFYFNWRKREHDYPRYHHVINNSKNIRDWYNLARQWIV